MGALSMKAIAENVLEVFLLYIFIFQLTAVDNVHFSP